MSLLIQILAIICGVAAILLVIRFVLFLLPDIARFFIAVLLANVLDCLIGWIGLILFGEWLNVVFIYLYEDNERTYPNKNKYHRLLAENLITFLSGNVSDRESMKTVICQMEQMANKMSKRTFKRTKAEFVAATLKVEEREGKKL